MSQVSAPSDTVPSQFMPRFRSKDWELANESNPLRVVVLASGHGSNLQAILDQLGRTRKAEVVGVASNNPSAFALTRAKKRGIPYAIFARSDYPDRVSRDEEMAEWIKRRDAGLIVLAGYLEILSPNFVNEFQKRIINIHPSLLPRFPGLHSIQRAYDARVRKSGVTIHFVDEGVDTGPVIRQKRIWRLPGETLERFERRVHAKEHKMLPDVIARIASGGIAIGVKSSATISATHSHEIEPVAASSYRHA